MTEQDLRNYLQRNYKVNERPNTFDWAVEALENMDIKLGMQSKTIMDLEEKVKQMSECLEWYADEKNCDNPDFAHVEIDEEGEEIADGGYRARKVLVRIKT